MIRSVTQIYQNDILILGYVLFPTSTPTMVIIGAMSTPTATLTITMATMLMVWLRIRRFFE